MITRRNSQQVLNSETKHLLSSGLKKPFDIEDGNSYVSLKCASVLLPNGNNIKRGDKEVSEKFFKKIIVAVSVFNCTLISYAGLRLPSRQPLSMRSLDIKCQNPTGRVELLKAWSLWFGLSFQ